MIDHKTDPYKCEICCEIKYTVAFYGGGPGLLDPPPR